MNGPSIQQASLSLLTGAAVAALSACGQAPTTASSEPITAQTLTLGGTPLFHRDGYDYGASIIQDGNTRKYWWCGDGDTPDGYHTDSIYYRTYDLSSGQYSAVQQVLAPRPSVATWDKSYICDPSVIQGQFNDPDDGRTYPYAMYFTATDRGPNSSYSGTNLDGTNNRIGVAFSTDGVTWTKYSQNPVIYPAVYPTDAYGAGQAATYSQDGAASLRVFYQDNSSGSTKVRQVTTPDGRSFGTPVNVTNTGLAPDGQTAPPGGNMDIAFDYQNRYWYIIMPVLARQGDREAYSQALARMPESSFPGGTWQRLGYVDTNLTGNTINHNPALVRDKFGNVNPTLPGVETVFASGTNDPGSWDLSSASWNPNAPTVSLKRYHNAGTGTYLVTSGYVNSGYTYQQTLGILQRGAVSGTVALYACSIANSSDLFVTLQANCEGKNPLGVNGFIYSSAPVGQSSAALYRCYTGTAHFVSTQSNCEGATTESLLGYALSVAANPLQNPGFETPLVSNFQTRPAGASWIFSGQSGIQHNGSAFGAASAPEGQQTAYLQGSPNGTGAVAQSVILSAGTYTLSLQAARRGNQVQPLRFSVDGTQTGGLLTPTDSSFATLTASFTVAAGTHTLKLESTDTSTDKTTFVDSVEVR